MATAQVHKIIDTKEAESSTWSSFSLLKIGGIMLTIAAAWRIIDQFVLNLGSTWMNILPSKLFPFLIILGLFWKYRPRETESVLGLSRNNFQAQLFFGFLIGLVISFGIDFGGTIVYGVFIDPTYPLQLHILNEGLLVYMFFFFLTNALLEETLFRGLLINAFKTHQSTNRAILMSAVIFGIWHAGWPIVNGAIGLNALSEIVSMVFFTTIHDTRTRPYLLNSRTDGYYISDVPLDIHTSRRCSMEVQDRTALNSMASDDWQNKQGRKKGP
ncbi:MAG: hypothetical protein AM326_07065 [Candidatus Thorarchaeota archaeon SMTZ-45]|nr:MAG: hypothetical protein AM326_07065 [Candidatus Thorarchaeota archaeon SMTZ-45]